jgi:Fe2+ or Zn2+ uptake regulation protein
VTTPPAGSGTASEDETGELESVVERRLRQIGQRYTAGRRAVVGLLAGAGHPVNIGDIADGLPDLPRSSAYRHLVDLESAGVVQRVAAGDEFARYELAEDLTEHHHHLLCVACGRVIDITPSPALERRVAEELDRLAADAGFVAESHRIDVLGRCVDCR